VRRLVDGPVWAAGIDGACVLRQRGGDFEPFVRRDLSIGYHSPDADGVTLYLIESRPSGWPEAAVPLVYG
jgi:uncharacterized linocin/CFP29 family protein